MEAAECYLAASLALGGDESLAAMLGGGGAGGGGTSAASQAGGGDADDDGAARRECMRAVQGNLAAARLRCVCGARGSAGRQGGRVEDVATQQHLSRLATIRVRGEIMGPGTDEHVGKSQSALISSNSLVPPRGLSAAGCTTGEARLRRRPPPPRWTRPG
jgi:hypothetical protein